MSDLKKIYHLENRANSFIFHWFFFMIAGLRHIPEIQKKEEEKLPVFIYTDPTTFTAWNTDTLELIEDMVQFIDIETEEFKAKKDQYQIIKHHGEPLLNASEVHCDAYHFLRNTFLPRLKINSERKKTRKIYISRNDSSTSNASNRGRKVRNILNEEELHEGLKALGFEIICLSNYSLQEKIELFQSASVIVSPHGSALSFCVFVNKDCKVVEILPENINFHNHYKVLCRNLVLPYYRFSDVSVVGKVGIHEVWNMNVKKEAFFKFLKMHI